ncbi:hypothetical protein J7E26_00455 [Bacillus sp. ISL-51]|uniref:hypothetical protein n=1 Tax=Bacteria TaxID=2 RepID=UPI001BEAFBA0|nr:MULTISPECIES: hypothetical protein [Bacteria]MBT2572441.1 hypothetical protein [Bacillus sp. ISL-51]MBT2711504.1 hypothetical protein [Pseudomonas sp. ISL-88]
MFAITFFSQKTVSLFLLLSGLFSSVTLYNGYTISDYIFQLIGFSAWSKTGTHLSVIPGITLYFGALIWCSILFRRTLPAAAFSLFLLSMGTASCVQPVSEKIAFIVMQGASEKQAVEYIKPDSECSHYVAGRTARMSCTIHVNHYGKEEQTISVVPALSKDIKGVTFYPKTFTVQPRSKAIIHTRFTGVNKGRIQSGSGYSSGPEVIVKAAHR